MFDVKPSGPCVKCKQREATQAWTCCTLCAVHGNIEFRCEQCMLEEQLENAERLAATIPGVKARLEALRDPGAS